MDFNTSNSFSYYTNVIPIQLPTTDEENPEKKISEVENKWQTYADELKLDVGNRIKFNSDLRRAKERVSLQIAVLKNENRNGYPIITEINNLIKEFNSSAETLYRNYTLFSEKKENTTLRHKEIAENILSAKVNYSSFSWNNKNSTINPLLPFSTNEISKLSDMRVSLSNGSNSLDLVKSFTENLTENISSKKEPNKIRNGLISTTVSMGIEKVASKVLKFEPPIVTAIDLVNENAEKAFTLVEKLKQNKEAAYWWNRHDVLREGISYEGTVGLIEGSIKFVQFLGDVKESIKDSLSYTCDKLGLTEDNVDRYIFSYFKDMMDKSPAIKDQRRWNSEMKARLLKRQNSMPMLSELDEKTKSQHTKDLQKIQSVLAVSSLSTKGSFMGFIKKIFKTERFTDTTFKPLSKETRHKYEVELPLDPKPLSNEQRLKKRASLNYRYDLKKEEKLLRRTKKETSSYPVPEDFKLSHEYFSGELNIHATKLGSSKKGIIKGTLPYKQIDGDSALYLIRYEQIPLLGTGQKLIVSEKLASSEKLGYIVNSALNHARDNKFSKVVFAWDSQSIRLASLLKEHSISPLRMNTIPSVYKCQDLTLIEVAVPNTKNPLLLPKILTNNK